jgi:4-hydroxyphenylpyruvate dioxygenase-like putative hemolysin
MAIQTATPELEKINPAAADFLPLLGTDYIEFYVGNAKQAAHYYKTAFGFQSLAYAGLETGVKDRTSYVIVQDKIRLVLTTPLTKDSPINDHLRQHGDGVKVIALWVDDARKAYEETTKRGAISFMEPTVRERMPNGEVVIRAASTAVRRHGTHLRGAQELQRHLFAGLQALEECLQPAASRPEIRGPHGSAT